MAWVTTGQQLQQAYHLIRTNRQDEAIRLLTQIVESDPDNADAWFLLAEASTDPAYIRPVLQHVLQLRPDDVRARAKLDALNAPVHTPGRAQPSFLRMRSAALSSPSPAVANPPRIDGKRTTRSLPVAKKSSRVDVHPLTTIGLSLLVFLVLGCGVCLLVTNSGDLLFGQLANAFNEALPALSGTVDAGPVSASGDITMRATLNYGGVVRGQLLRDGRDGYWFNGDAGDFVVIDAVALDTALNPVVALYDPAGQRLTWNDDYAAGENQNARVTHRLMESGRYLVVVSGSGDTNGAYQVVVRRG